MAAKRQQPDGRERRPELVESHGALTAVWPKFTVRFMFSDGRTVDVITSRDDSDLRAALLDHFNVEAIRGSTRLPVTEEGDNNSGER